LLCDITNAGRFSSAMTLAIVNVLPEPVTEERLVCVASPDRLHELGDRLALIPLGENSLLSLKSGTG